MSTIASCPGKVLIAGGYLVLDPAHHGFVISTPSRFYTVVQEAPKDSSLATDTFTITVKSPQFSDGLWEYVAKNVEGEWELSAASTSASANPFVQLSIQSSLLLSSALAPSATYTNLVVTIVGSNDFYSQSRSDVTPIPFAPLNVAIKDVHKTGLGSSAAMVTSLTSALLLHWTAPDPETANELAASPPPPSTFPQSSRPSSPDKATTTLLHNLAQYVHSLAQGKVGSGFDVSAAVWGSQVYRRFAVECLGDLLNPDVKDAKLAGKDLLQMLSPLYNPLWTKPATQAMVSPFALPPGTTLILADVDAGSNTPSMVGKVLAWKKKDPERAEQLWNELKESNSALAEVFGNIARLASKDDAAFKKEIEQLAATKSDEWENSAYPFFSAREHILATRKNMREMGELSGVPIEPPEQTRLLNACSDIPGVIGAGVPGAGGYDAIWVLVIGEKAEKDVEVLLRGWTEMSVRPLSKNAWARGGREEDERGVLREELDKVEGLRAAVEGTQ
ncbi:phosphomevalonate kinase [Pseudohyphozyma bogoriensis]|nr:phosphomevalonate kinase [Pseudohyphozyma bogoriensis]